MSCVPRFLEWIDTNFKIGLFIIDVGDEDGSNMLMTISGAENLFNLFSYESWKFKKSRFELQQFIAQAVYCGTKMRLRKYISLQQKCLYDDHTDGMNKDVKRGWTHELLKNLKSAVESFVSATYPHNYFSSRFNSERLFYCG